MIKTKEWQQKTTEELQELKRNLKGQLSRQLFAWGTKNLKDTSQLKKQRRDLARVLTILNTRINVTTIDKK